LCFAFGTVDAKMRPRSCLDSIHAQSLAVIPHETIQAITNLYQPAGSGSVIDGLQRVMTISSYNCIIDRPGLALPAKHAELKKVRTYNRELSSSRLEPIV
jgi:hypothetical protein